jgi:uncharacterized protein YecT (DUF1311 family)
MRSLFTRSLIASALVTAAAGHVDAAPADDIPEDCGVYYFGIGQPKDLARAFQCEIRTPDFRKDWAMITIHYLNGEGTARDLVRARQAFAHLRGESGATEAALEEALRLREAKPGKIFPRIDFCKDIAIATPDANYCDGVAARMRSARLKKDLGQMRATLDPAAKKAFDKVASTFKHFQEEDGKREYLNFIDGTIRNEAATEQERRVLAHYREALAAWGPQATSPPALPRPLRVADDELNQVYQDIRKVDDTVEPESQRAQNLADARDQTRTAQRAWLKYVAAWTSLVKQLNTDDADAADNVRAYLTEQRIRELKISSVEAETP